MEASGTRSSIPSPRSRWNESKSLDLELSRFASLRVEHPQHSDFERLTGASGGRPPLPQSLR